MTLAVWYWILMLLWAVFGVWSNYPYNSASLKPAGNQLILFLLLLILGWAQFGSPLHGG
jgi:hypothetical protein